MTPSPATSSPASMSGPALTIWVSPLRGTASVPAFRVAIGALLPRTPILASSIPPACPRIRTICIRASGTIACTRCTSFLPGRTIWSRRTAAARSRSLSTPTRLASSSSLRLRAPRPRSRSARRCSPRRPLPLVTPTRSMRARARAAKRLRISGSAGTFPMPMAPLPPRPMTRAATLSRPRIGTAVRA